MNNEQAVVWDAATREAKVKERLAQQTPTDIMDHTYRLVPLRSFSKFELCGIIEVLSVRLYRRECHGQQSRDEEKVDQYIETDRQ